MSTVIDKLKTSLTNFKKAAAADILAADAKIKSEALILVADAKNEYTKIKADLPKIGATIKYDVNLATTNIKAEVEKLTLLIKNKEAEIVEHSNLITEVQFMVASLKSEAEKAYSLLNKLVSVIETPKPVTPTPAPVITPTTIV